MHTLLAQITNPALNPTVQNESGQTFFNSFIPALVGIGFVIGALFFLFNLIMGAVQWINSGGNKASIEEARNKIVNAIVGIVVLFCVYGILNLVGCFFRINLIKVDIGELNVGFSGTPNCSVLGGPSGGTPTPTP